MSSGLKAAPKYYKSCLQITPKHYFGPLISAPGPPEILKLWLLVGGGPTKVMTMIWAHLLIFVRCGLVTLMLQFMLKEMCVTICCIVI